MKKNNLLFLFLIFVTILSAQTPCPGTPTVTFENKTYNTVQIGNQCWLKENLDVGAMILGSVDQSNNGIIEKYCYDDNLDNCTKYGGLYTWNEAMKYPVAGKNTQGLCPKGWHIPLLEDFKELQSFVKSDAAALKDVNLASGSLPATNSSGFSALLSGARGAIRNNGSYFSHLKVYALLWSSTEYNADYAYVMDLAFNNQDINIYGNGKQAAFCIRCIKGEGTVDVQQNKNVPNEFSLLQNYPNPFNPETSITYNIPTAAFVSLKIYDVLGNELIVLVNELKQPGSYKYVFDMHDYNLGSGVYFYKLAADGFCSTKKMLYLK